MSTGWILLILWELYWLIWGIFAIITDQKHTRIYNVFSYLGVLVFISFIGLFEKFAKSHFPINILPHYTIMIIIGFIFIALGFVFTIWARIILGNNWSGEVGLVLNHKLIREGPYKIVRHPIYTGQFLALLGTGFILVDIVGIGLFIVSIVAYTDKSINEEKLLLSKYGAEYEQYKKEVKMLIPFLV